MHSLNLFSRPTGGRTASLGNITALADNWSRSSRSVGGYWGGQFTILGAKLSRRQLIDFFLNNVGMIVKEQASGMPSWEGFIIEMRLILDGIEHMISIDPRWTHNKTKILYTFPDVVDSEQGNLVYDPDLPPDFSFQDDGQDFEEWETLAGDAVNRIVVTNSDGTENWGFLGASSNMGQNIVVHDEIDLSDDDWQGTERFDLSGQKTPISYVIEDIQRSGVVQDTGFLVNQQSVDEFGAIEHIETIGSESNSTALTLRSKIDREHSWPRPRAMGTVDFPLSKSEQLIVMVAGFWHSANWGHITTDYFAGGSGLIQTLVAQTELLQMGPFDYNGIAVRLEAAQSPKRIGEALGQVASIGDMEANLWHVGVYDDRKVEYVQGPTTVDYKIEQGVLVDRVGRPANGPQLRPGFLVRVGAAFIGWAPPVTTVWNDPEIAYVEEVIYVAPNTIKLRLLGMETSLITLRAQAQA